MGHLWGIYGSSSLSFPQQVCTLQEERLKTATAVVMYLFMTKIVF